MLFRSFLTHKKIGEKVRLKAAVLVELNSPLEILELESNDLEVGQVLVKIKMSGICGAQLLEIKGYKNNEKFLPHLMGHEGFGVVISVGAGILDLKPGDSVVMHWRKSRGIEAIFPVYNWGNSEIGGGKVTTLSSYSVVSHNRLTKVPSDTNPVLGALMGCALTTSFGLLENNAKLRLGESVAVIGCGGLGLTTIQCAKLRGAGPI